MKNDEQERKPLPNSETTLTGRYYNTEPPHQELEPVTPDKVGPIYVDVECNYAEVERRIAVDWAKSNSERVGVTAILGKQSISFSFAVMYGRAPTPSAVYSLAASAQLDAYRQELRVILGLSNERIDEIFQTARLLAQTTSHTYISALEYIIQQVYIAAGRGGKAITAHSNIMDFTYQPNEQREQPHWTQGLGRQRAKDRRTWARKGRHTHRHK